MPALPAVPQTLRCQFLWSDSTDTNVTSTMYFSYNGSEPTISDCNQFAAELVAAMTAQVDVWPGSVDLLGATVTDLSSSTGAEGVATTSVPGGDAGGNLAGGTCVVVNYQIARRYRGGKPRNYFPFGTAATLSTRQAWTNTFVNEVHDSIAAVVAAFVGTTKGSTTISSHVNVSYYSGSRVVTSPTTGRARNVPILRATPLVNPIVGITVAVNPGTQRRRNR